MYRIEIENADETVFMFQQNGLWDSVFESEDSADTVALSLWQKYGETGKYLRFSVVDEHGVRLSDWGVNFVSH